MDDCKRVTRRILRLRLVISTSSDATTGAESQPETDAGRKHRRRVLGQDLTIVTVGAFVVLGLVLVPFVAVIVHWPPGGDALSFWDRIVALVGFWLTGSALVVALLIYQTQRQESRDQEVRLNHFSLAQEQRLNDFTSAMESRMHGRFDNLEDKQAAQVTPDIHAIQQFEAAGPQLNPSEVDPYADLRDLPAMSSDELEKIGVSPERAMEFKVYSPLQIPLRVLGDLHVGWIAMQESGELDRKDVRNWETGEAVAYRRRARGNHAWYVRLTNADETYLWQVSRGGQGTTGPTVKQVSVEPSRR